MHDISHLCFLFFFNDTATTEIYTLSLHDALPICLLEQVVEQPPGGVQVLRLGQRVLDLREDLPLADHQDRKSTRLNSSHANISYAVFCLKKKSSLPFCSDWASYYNFTYSVYRRRL